jgi:chromosome segregation ATPase
MHAARAETLRLKQALATTKEDVAGLTRWNRQEMKDRRETEQENEGLRERVAQMSRRLRRVAERAREGPEGQHRETSADTNPTGATPGVTNSTIAAATTIINPAVQQRQQERQQGRQQERQEQRQQERREQRQQDRRQQQQEPLLQAKVADLEDELQMARCLRESLETAVADTTGQLRTALGRLTGLEALVQAHEAGRNLVDEAQEEVERLELANHDLSREVMGLEALLEEARQAAESEKRQLAMMKVGMEEAMVKAQASVDEIIQLKMAEADLMGQVTHLEAERAQDQARISLMQEERDAWRKRAEEEVSEWVGVLAEGGADADREGKPDEEAAAAAAAEAVVDAADAAEVEAAATTTTTTGTPAVATINTPLSPPDREELGGLDPLEALMGENLALRAQIEGLRRREAEMQLV